MNETFKKYVTDIVNETGSSPETKADLFEELTAHLEDSYEAFIKDGFNENEAEKQAIQNFGDVKEIGNDLRQAMFPYQRELLFTLAISSIIYSFLVYLVQLFIEGDAHIWWLIPSIFISSVLLFFVFQVLREDGRKWLNTALVFHIIIYFLGLGLAVGLDSFLVSMLAIFCVLIILLALTLVYLNVTFHREMHKLEKGFHFFNMSLGLIIIAVNLFFIWAFLLFSEGLTVKSAFLLTPIVLWVLSYIIQIRFLNKGWIKASFGVAAIPALLVGGIILFQISVFFISG